MLKRPGNPDISTTAFSIARQFTGPPFSHALEAATLRMKLLEALHHPKPVPKLGKPAKVKSAAKKSPARKKKS
jgi:hypothetical protein